MSKIPTRLGDLEESLLIKRQDKTIIERDDYHAVAVSTEYCEAYCQGVAHVTNVPDSDSCFCQHHVRRDVHVDVLKMVGLSPQLFSANDLK